MKNVLVTVLIVLAATIFAQSTNPLPIFGATPEIQYQKHYYRLYTAHCDIETARRAAARDGGYLVEINDEAENKFLVEWLHPYVGKFFIGAARNNKGKWSSPNGLEYTFTNWINDAAARNARLAVIEIQESDGQWYAMPGNIKANGFIVEFTSKPKPLPKIATDIDLMENYETEVTTASESSEGRQVVLSDLPSGLSANLFYSQYAYAGGMFRDRYLDQKTTLAGITDTTEIREITENDPLWSKYKGKFFMRLLGDNVICFLTARPLLEDNGGTMIFRVQGTVKKGIMFQQVILDDARVVNFRKILSERKLSIGRHQDNPPVSGLLTKFDNLLNQGTFELQVGKEGESVQCTMGPDPEGYALEVYCLKQSGAIKDLALMVVGTPTAADDKESPQTNCRILIWGSPRALMPGGGEQRPRRAPNAQPANGQSDSK